MKRIKLKKGKTIPRDYNCYGLSLNQFYELQGGGILEVDFETIHPQLLKYVYVTTPKKAKRVKGEKNGD